MHKILIIEDDQAFRKALGETLTAEGMQVSEATDGEEGLAACQSEKPDLVLLDLDMPNVDGIEFLKQLRASDDARMPVLITSNHSDLDKNCCKLCDNHWEIRLARRQHHLRRYHSLRA